MSTVGGPSEKPIQPTITNMNAVDGSSDTPSRDSLISEAASPSFDSTAHAFKGEMDMELEENLSAHTFTADNSQNNTVREISGIYDSILAVHQLEPVDVPGTDAHQKKEAFVNTEIPKSLKKQEERLSRVRRSGIRGSFTNKSHELNKIHEDLAALYTQAKEKGTKTEEILPKLKEFESKLNQVQNSYESSIANKLDQLSKKNSLKNSEEKFKANHNNYLEKKDKFETARSNFYPQEVAHINGVESPYDEVKDPVGDYGDIPDSPGITPKSSVEENKIGEIRPNGTLNIE